MSSSTEEQKEEVKNEEQKEEVKKEAEEEEEKYEAPIPAQVGQKAPRFIGQAVNSQNEFFDLNLKDYKGQFIVLFSYPFNNCTITPSEIIALSENIPRLQELNCQVIGITTENIYSITRMKTLSRSEGGFGSVAFPIISDVTHKISSMYNFYSDYFEYDYRGICIIDPESTIRHLSLNGMECSRSIEEIIRLIKGFTFSMQNGVVCPANWQDGQPTIKPTIKESLDYFSQIPE